MPDATPIGADTPQEDEDEAEEEEEDNNDVEETHTPSRASEQPSRSATPRRGRPSIRRGRRGGRLGRPPKDRAPVGSEDGDNDGASETATPKRRGGFRGHRGGRWAKYRAGGSRPQQAPLDEDGNPMEIVNDEVLLPDDEEGEDKVDKNGRLLGGREYRVRTFTILGRDNRLYMLSTEPARCIGFRDSYLFFQKHKHLYKIIIDDDEKRDLIDRDLIPHSYKGRAIGVVTARSVFREFGARIVIGGKKVTDDYQTQAARERGDVEGELAVPEDRLPAPGEPYNRNQYVAWHGASAVYHTNTPSVPLPLAKVQDAKRRKIVVTSDNWMLEHAREARSVVLVKRSCLSTDSLIADSTRNLQQLDLRIVTEYTTSTQTSCNIRPICSQHMRDGKWSTTKKIEMLTRHDHYLIWTLSTAETSEFMISASNQLQSRGSQRRASMVKTEVCRPFPPPFWMNSLPSASARLKKPRRAKSDGEASGIQNTKTAFEPGLFPPMNGFPNEA